MPDQENPPTKVPTSYDKPAKEENPIPKAPVEYSATPQETPPADDDAQ